MRHYIKRVLRAVLNRPEPQPPIKNHIYTLEKEYVIHMDASKCFSGKVAFVVGASGWLGGAISLRLAYEGANVYLGGRNIQKLHSLADVMKEKDLVGVPRVIDVTDNESIETAVAEIMKECGHIDILVNCAGGSTRDNCANIVDQKVKLIDGMLNMNLRGSMLCTRAVGREMVKAGYGKIVNISSVIGEHGKPKFSDYAAAKAGIIGYTKSAAQELGPYGINVNCISPGFIQRDQFTDAQLPYLLNSNFMHRVGTAEDIASAVAYLVSDEAAFITGQNLCVDGGRSLGLHGD